METECNVCGGSLQVPDDVIKGEIVSCPDCGVEYEVSEIRDGNPVLRAAEEIREDWGE
ncbi:MAG: hypothetical protein AMDU1_APLC00004G0060 [Thermoplasmatales archaeon A-plasma]|jgi:alpha-aminoadipate carrier protein LysW|nr:MAG: hypothetical protein AMDU5_GPLC00017G0081 [Thermoplasmatales archaeon Gpl]EQB72748.1 MAG: hypothetical protein AMDU1_APLC00004G0060 [Thermoplasmatales archaeon A-plasma]MCL4331368.1 hypothetical protein [Candidatus Thermoplasmatota archaeon]MCL5732632.1 hypothetical protein [Candidatus Thermoplasmatota archaeon]WMT45408.1 MAG: alpha-aminoadipate/glutamate carrier protein LysW/ArgW [Cuniculiplasma divulgatum]